MYALDMKEQQEWQNMYISAVDNSPINSSSNPIRTKNVRLKKEKASNTISHLTPEIIWATLLVEIITQLYRKETFKHLHVYSNIDDVS